MRAGARSMPGRRRSGGFTLIELVVACAVAGILAAIAYPTYTQYVLKSHRATAKAILSEQAQYMERYYTSKGTYVGANELVKQSPKNGESRYAISLTDVTETGFTVVADPVEGTKQVDDECGKLTLNHTGATAAKENVKNCW